MPGRRDDSPPSGDGGRDAGLANRLPLKPVLATLAAVGAVLAAGGAVAIEQGALKDGPYHPFNLDGEYTVPAIATALALGLAAALAFEAGKARRERAAWSVIAAVLALMAADELFGVHEILERATSTDWQTLYVPVVGAALVAGLMVLVRLGAHPAAAAWLVAGGAAWLAAMVLEQLEWSGPREAEVAADGYGAMMYVEELLEYAGAGAFVVAALLAARAGTVGTRRARGHAAA